MIPEVATHVLSAAEALAVQREAYPTPDELRREAGEPDPTAKAAEAGR